MNKSNEWNELNRSSNTTRCYKQAIKRFEESNEPIEVYFSKLSYASQAIFIPAAKLAGYDISIIKDMKKANNDVKSFKAFTLNEIMYLRKEVLLMDLKYQAIVLTQLETGCRRHEVCLIWNEFANEKSKTLFIFGKGNKKGKIFITDELYEILNQWVFSNEFKNYSLKQINNLTQEALEKAGLKGSCHDLRRAFATNLRRHFVPLEHIQILLRHEDISTTIRYIRVTDEEIFNSLEHKYLNVDAYVNKSNFREKYLELIQKHIRLQGYCEELETRITKCAHPK